MGDSLFAAYDPLDIKAAKNLIVASSDYLYTPRSLFGPVLIFLTAPKLDWGQSVGMTISVQRTVSMDPQVIIIAGSNDNLQSRGLLSRLTDGSIPSNEIMGEAIMTLLSAMTVVESSVQRHFTRNVVKIIFVLSPGYAKLPEPLQFVCRTVTPLAEGRFNVIIPASNRIVDPNNYYPLCSKLPAVWADISNAIQWFKDCSTIRVLLDEVLGLELSKFARLLKLRPGVDDSGCWCNRWRLTSGLEVWIILGTRREHGQKKSDISGRGPHGTDLEDKATYQFMAVFITESVCLG